MSDELFDRYLEDALQGRLHSPGGFLRRHGRDDPALLAELRVVFRQLAGARAGVEQTLRPPGYGDRLGPFQLLRQIGRGGFGEVYEAEDADGSRCALKLLRFQLRTSPERRKRFEREASAVQRLEHPHIVRLLAAGEIDGILYLAMPLVAGTTLSAVVHEQLPPTQAVLRWCLQIAGALQCVHGHGFIHRDVKPANIMIQPDGQALLLDFGLVFDTLAELATLTRGFLGTPAFAAPEQGSRVGRSLSTLSDVYGLAATLYYALSGAAPFGQSPRHERPLRPAPIAAERGLPMALDDLLARALALDPTARPASAQSFAQELETISAQAAPQAKARGSDAARDWNSLLRQAGPDSETLLHTYRLEAQQPASARVSPPSPFELLEPIGRGGNGVVFRARQHRLDRLVAIKVVRGTDAERRACFVDEALLASRLEHPNILPVYDLLDGEDVQLAMKLVEGETWAGQLASGEVARAAHLETLATLCNAVAFAHSRGVLHNDLKPANVLLGPFGEVLLCDWGVAVELADEDAAQVRSRSAILGPCGTPAYMPPELAVGDTQRLSVRSDVYQLGAILFEILVGKPPNDRQRFLAFVKEEVSPAPPLPEGLPDELVRLCQGALACAPEQRPPTVLAFQQRLQAYFLHRESLQVSASARQLLEQCEARANELEALAEAQKDQLYASYAEAVAGFGHAQRLWDANPQARDGVASARRSYAEVALRSGDLRLARAQLAALPQPLPAGDSLPREVDAARLRREQSQRTARRLRLGLLLAVVAVVLGQSLSQIYLLRARNQAQDASNTAQAMLLEQTRLTREVFFDGAMSREAAAGAIALLESSRSNWQRLRAEGLEGDSLAQGLIYQDLGEIYLQLDDHPYRARAQLEAARTIFANYADTAHGKLDLALCLISLGDCSTLASALRYYRQADSLLESSELQAEKTAPRAAVAWLRLQLRLAETDLKDGSLLRVVARLETAIQRGRALHDAAEDGSFAPPLGDLLLMLAACHELLERSETAGAVLEEALRLARGHSLTASFDPRVRLSLARACLELSEFLFKHGDAGRAFALGAQSLELAHDAHGADPSNVTLRFLLARALTNSASQLVARHDSDDASAHLERASGLLQALPARQYWQKPGEILVQVLLAQTVIADRRAQTPRAHALADDAVARALALVETMPDPRTARRLLRSSLALRGQLLASTGHLSRAHQDLQRALELIPRSGHPGSELRVLHCELDIANSLVLERMGESEQASLQLAATIPSGESNLTQTRSMADAQRLLLALSRAGAVLWGLGRQDIAGPLLMRLQAQADSWLERSPDNQLLLLAWLDVQLAAGQAQISGAPELAEATLSKVLELIDRLLADRPGRAILQLERAQALRALGSLHAAAEDSAEAQQLWQQSLVIYRALELLDPEDRSHALAITGLLREQANRAYLDGQLAEGKLAIDEACQRLRRLCTEAPDNLGTRFDLAQALGLASALERHSHDPMATARLLLEALEVLPAELRASNWQKDGRERLRREAATLHSDLLELADHALQTGKYGEASRHYALMVRLDRLLEPLDAQQSTSWLTPDLGYLAAARFHERAFEAAIVALDEALSLRPELAILYEQRAMAHLELGQAAAAAADLSEQLKRAPEAEQAYRWRALAHMLCDRPDAARADFEAAAALKDSPYPLLWSVLLGGEARKLERWAGDAAWPGPLLDFALGRLSQGGLLQRAQRGSAAARNAQLCEAHAVLGLVAERAGREDLARRHYEACRATGLTNFIEHRWADWRLKQWDAR